MPINTKLTGTDLQAILTFDNTNGEPIIAKVGLSLVSVQNARQNMEAEVKDFDLMQYIQLLEVLGNNNYLLLLWRVVVKPTRRTFILLCITLWLYPIS